MSLSFRYLRIDDEAMQLMWVHLPNGKVDNRWIFLQKERIFGETFYVQDDEGWQSRNFESFQNAVFVRFVFLFIDCIEFGQQLI